MSVGIKGKGDIASHFDHQDLSIVSFFDNGEDFFSVILSNDTKDDGFAGLGYNSSATGDISGGVWGENISEVNDLEREIESTLRCSVDDGEYSSSSSKLISIFFVGVSFSSAIILSSVTISMVLLNIILSEFSAILLLVYSLLNIEYGTLYHYA